MNAALHTQVNDRVLAAHALKCERDGRVLFDGLELALHRGEVVELTGANGSGKTTLLRILAGLTSDYSGEMDVRMRTPGWLLYLGHRAGLSAALTPLENLRWYTRLSGGSTNEADQLAALSRVGLAGYEDTPCHLLSAGQQRRATLARLVPGEAAVWLLDEPLTALDTEGASLLRVLLDAHRSLSGAAVCATHQSLGLERTTSLILGARP